MEEKYTIKQAADFLGVNAETLRRWDKSGKLKAEKANKRGDRRYDKKQLEQFKQIVRLPVLEKEQAKILVDKTLVQLDKLAEENRYIFGVGDALKEARDVAYFILDDEETSNRYQCYLDIFNFVLKGDELGSKMSGTDTTGKEWHYPTVDTFKEADFLDIESTITKYKNPRVLAQMAHFLWAARKNYKMGRIAVEQYLKLVNWFVLKDKGDPESHFGLDILNALENALILSKKLKYKEGDVLKNIADIILTFSELSSSKYKLKIELIRLCYENKASFDTSFWKSVLGICKKYAEELTDKRNSYFARDYLELGHKIETNVLGLKQETWKRALAESFLKESESNANSFVQVDILNKAYENYKELKDTKMMKLIEDKLKTAKKNMQFQTFEQTIDLKDWAEDVRKKFAEIIMNESPSQILVRLTGDSSIIPSFQAVSKLSEDMTKQFPLQHIFSQYVVDGQDNIIRKYESDSERQYLSLLRHWGISFETNKLLLLILFDEIIKSKKLTWEAVQEFMQTYLWYGAEYSIKLSETVTLNKRKWIELLEPGIRLYIEELYKIDESVKNGNTHHIELVASMDSLTLKIEGIIRELYEKVGYSTDKIKRIGNTTLSEKKVLDDMLRDPQAEEIFGKDLLLLMKYVLIEPAGYNLRNNVAHTFMLRQNYLLIYAHLIFLIILRIGNFKLDNRENSQVKAE